MYHKIIDKKRVLREKEIEDDRNMRRKTIMTTAQNALKRKTQNIKDPTFGGLMRPDEMSKEEWLERFTNKEISKEELENKGWDLRPLKDLDQPQIIPTDPRDNKPDAWIQTFTGRKFKPTNPSADDVCIEDIAHALSMQCRYTGHSKEFYSVAQHSVLVSYLCDSQYAIEGLLHDGSEAYLIDVPRPLKQSGKFNAYLDFEKAVTKCICEKFDLLPEEPASVKNADKLMLYTESQTLMAPMHPEWTNLVRPLPMAIISLMPKEAEKLFLERFYELVDLKKEAEIQLEENEKEFMVRFKDLVDNL